MAKQVRTETIMSLAEASAQYFWIRDINNPETLLLKRVNADGSESWIPKDPLNRDWQEFELWRGEGNEPHPPGPIPPPPVPESLSRRQFFQIAAMMGLITTDEAMAAVQHGAIPAQMTGFVNAIPDPQQKFAAQMLIAGASEFDRHHQLTTAFAHYLGMTDEQLDEMWRQGAML